VRDATAWQAWLAKHHDTSAGVRLVLAKKGVATPTRLRYEDALPEAIAQGWIDGHLRPRDEATYTVRFTPRRRQSRWSKRNTELAERLLAERRMQPAGLAEVERAKADGRWAAAYSAQADIEVPADLAAALDASARARDNFEKLTRLNRYAVLYRVGDAKRAETRERRIRQFVEMLERGETVYPQKQPLSR